MQIRRLSARRFHRSGIRDAFLNFEEGETTFSHLFRRPHPFLKGRCYGEAFYDGLGRWFGISGFENVLEIGAGTGCFGGAFVRRWLRSGSWTPKSYTIVDAAPALIASQKKELSRARVPIRWLRQNAEALSLPARPFEGLVIANEMVADLDVMRFRLDWKELSPKNPKKILRGLPKNIRPLVARYGLPWVASHTETLFPIGLVRMLERLHSQTGSDTPVVLTEYFAQTGGGQVAPQPGHLEFSLRMDWVIEIARKIGFHVSAVPLQDFLGLSISRPVARRSFLRFKERILGGHGRLVSRSDGMRLFSTAEMGRFCSMFYVLVLRKKSAVARKNEAVLLFRDKRRRPFLFNGFNGNYYQLNESAAKIWTSKDQTALVREFRKKGLVF